MNLFGKFRHVIDAKGRIAIPLRLRDRLIVDGSRWLVILGGFEGCLFCYPMHQFRLIMEQLGRQSFDHAHTRELLRWLSAYGSEVEIDAQGRVQLTEEQRQIAGLEHEALLLGVGARLEVWSPERFENRPNKTDGAALAEGVLHTLPQPPAGSKE